MNEPIKAPQHSGMDDPINELEASIFNTVSSARLDAEHDLRAWAHHPTNDEPTNRGHAPEAGFDDLITLVAAVLLFLTAICGVLLAIVTAYNLIAKGIGGPAALALLVLLTGVGIGVTKLSTAIAAAPTCREGNR